MIGIANLAEGLATLALQELNISFCQFGSKVGLGLVLQFPSNIAAPPRPQGMTNLAKAFKNSETIPYSLRKLNISGNKIGNSGTGAVVDWLTVNCIHTLEELVISNTNVNVQKFASILSTECVLLHFAECSR